MIMTEGAFLSQNTKTHVPLILTKALPSDNQYFKHFANVKE